MVRRFNSIVKNLDTVHWSIARVGGTIPSARAYHTMSRFGSILVLFAGFDGQSYLNDVHVLDTESMQWSQPSTSGTISS
jgi:hypothetical protein